MGENLPLQIAQRDPYRLIGADVPQRVERLQRISVEFAAIIDPAQARAQEEVVLADFMPQIVDFLHLGEEAVAANVEAETLVDLGPGDPADVIAFFENDGVVRHR